MHDDRLAFFRLAGILALIFGPMCVPYAVNTALDWLRARRAPGRHAARRTAR